MSSSLPPGHPCGFARTFLGDPFVEEGVKRYSALVQEKDALLQANRFQEAWETLQEIRRLEQDLAEHCEKLRQKQNARNG